MNGHGDGDGDDEDGRSTRIIVDEPDHKTYQIQSGVVVEVPIDAHHGMWRWAGVSNRRTDETHEIRHGKRTTLRSAVVTSEKACGIVVVWLDSWAGVRDARHGISREFTENSYITQQLT